MARECVSLVEKRGGSATAGPLYVEFQKTIESALQQAEKDNGFIYHIRVPDASSLSPIDKAIVAKSTPMANPLSSNFTGWSVYMYIYINVHMYIWFSLIMYDFTCEHNFILQSRVMCPVIQFAV